MLRAFSASWWFIESTTLPFSTEATALSGR